MLSVYQSQFMDVLLATLGDHLPCIADLLPCCVLHPCPPDALSLRLLQGVISPWLHHLHLAGLTGVEDDWMPVLAGARHCTSLNISGAAVRAGRAGTTGANDMPHLLQAAQGMQQAIY